MNPTNPNPETHMCQKHGITNCIACYSPSPEAGVDWEEQADDFCIWLTGGVSEFSLPRERVMAYWKIEFKKSLKAAYEAGILSTNKQQRRK